MNLEKTIKSFEDVQGILSAKCPCCEKNSVMIYKFVWDMEDFNFFEKKYKDKAFEHALDYQCMRCSSDLSFSSIKKYNLELENAKRNTKKY